MKFRQSGKKKNRKLKDPLSIRIRRFFSKYYKLLIVLVTLPAVTYSGLRIYEEIMTSPFLVLKSINVMGTQRVAKEDVIGLSSLKEGQNLFSFKAEEVIERIKGNPWVEDVALRRRLLDTVDIDITERQPLALVKLDGLYVMDESGVVFKKLTEEDELDLPVITGLSEGGSGEIEGKVFELMKVLKERSGFNLASVSEIHVDPAFGLSVYTLDEGVRLDFGKGEFERKLLSFEKVLEARSGALAGIDAIDLDSERDVIVKFTTNVVKEGGEANGQKG